MATCPQCGGELIKRQARRGRNAGGWFYGCSNWQLGGRGCSFTSPVEGVGIDPPVLKPIERQLLDLPVSLIARPKFTTHRVAFFQSLALPRLWVKALHAESTEARRRWELRSTWRLDLPIMEGVQPDSASAMVLSVAEKILRRGRLTVISPTLEDILGQIAGVSFSSQISDATIIDQIKADHTIGDLWFDGPSGTEAIFYSHLLPAMLGISFPSAVLPQVQLASLLDDIHADPAILSQRVDFLITTDSQRIVVEIDGMEHNDHVEKDEGRKRLLTSSGFTVISIQNEEVLAGTGPALQRLAELLSPDLEPTVLPIEDPGDLLIHAVIIAHQLQLAIVELLLSGVVAETSTILLDTSALLLEGDFLGRIATASLAELQKMIGHLAAIHGVSFHIDQLKIRCRAQNESGDLVLSFGDSLDSETPTATIQSFNFVRAIEVIERPANATDISTVPKDSAEFFLHYIFGHKKFREGQFEAVSRTLTNRDSIVLLPTGHGKSAAFQLAALLLPGVAIVVDPILSLIDDQLDNLRKNGIDRAVGISSLIEGSTAREALIRMFARGSYLFCYIAPERFQTVQFRDAIRSLTVSTPVALVAIDEAHCVSEWGHDFRTAYLNIGRISRELCRGRDGRIPPLLALTGTASHAVLRDVQRELQIEDIDAIITPRTFDRPELSFSIFPCTSNQKFTILSGLLNQWLPSQFNSNAVDFFQPAAEHTKSGLVFCPHVNGDFGVSLVSHRLSKELQRPVGMYAGQKPKTWNTSTPWNAYKRKASHDFKNNEISLLVATKSFGMGIDKPNVRYTVHYGLPASIESFYQEAGRAGRDGRRAHCCIVVSNDNATRTERILSPQTSLDEVSRIMDQDRTWQSDDDITRAIYFHLRAFRGIVRELEDLDIIFEVLGDLSQRRTVTLVPNALDRTLAERMIHRLLVIGVVSDYTINYSANEFIVSLTGATKESIVDSYCRYVQSYNRGRVATERAALLHNASEDIHLFVRASCNALITFVYDTIERGRRRALREMLTVAEEANAADGDQVVRDRVLRYLEASHSTELDNVLSETTGFDHAVRLIDGEAENTGGESIGGVRSAMDAMAIRGQVSRYLESYPDHPGLLALRSATEILCPDFSMSTALENLQAARTFALERYGWPKDKAGDLCTWVIAKLCVYRNSDYREAICGLLYPEKDLLLARSILFSRYAEPGMLEEPITFVLGLVATQIDSDILTN